MLCVLLSIGCPPEIMCKQFKLMSQLLELNAPLAYIWGETGEDLEILVLVCKGVKNMHTNGTAIADGTKLLMLTIRMRMHTSTLWGEWKSRSRLGRIITMSLRLKMYKQLYCNCFSISFFHIAVLPIWTQFVEVEFTAPVEVWHAGWRLHAVHKHTAVRE